MTVISNGINLYLVTTKTKNQGAVIFLVGASNVVDAAAIGKTASANFHNQKSSTEIEAEVAPWSHAEISDQAGISSFYNGNIFALGQPVGFMAEHNGSQQWAEDIEDIFDVCENWFDDAAERTHKIKTVDALKEALAQAPRTIYGKLDGHYVVVSRNIVRPDWAD